MKKVCFLSVAVLPALLFARDIYLKNGECLYNAEVMRVTTKGIYISHDSGSKTVTPDELSERAQSFLSKDIARYKLAFVIEEIQSSNSASHIEQLIEKNPVLKNYPDIRKHLAQTKYNEVERAINSRSILDIEEVLNEHPDAANADIARAQIKVLKAEAIQKAIDSKSIVNIRKTIAAYPDASNVSEAEKAINELVVIEKQFAAQREQRLKQIAERNARLEAERRRRAEIAAHRERLIRERRQKERERQQLIERKRRQELEKIARSFKDGEALFAQNNFAEAAEAYLYAADRGHLKAQYKAGISYMKTSSYTAAGKYLHSAAGHNHAEAAYKLGYLYENGLGVGKSYVNAEKYYELAHKHNGPSDAAYRLGVFHEKGYLGRRDKKQAVSYYFAAFRKGNAQAALRLGKCYENGDLGINTNSYDAEFYYHAAYINAYTEKDNSVAGEAGFRAANILWSKKEFSQAIYSYRKAAQLGHKAARIKLVMFDYTGQGFAGDWEDTKRWFRNAFI